MYLFNELVEKPLAQHYPPNVAKRVKQALYYASRNDAQSMANSFKKAIQLAEEAGLHPLSNEIAGLKIECAALLTKINDGEYKGKAVEILEKVLDEAVAGAEYFTERERWKDRSVVLQRAVLLGYKVGEMYTEMDKMRQAEEAMVWSTETLLREIHRRERDKVKEEEQGEWFDRMAVAGCLEKLATHYEATNQHTLATPLYLRAATLSPQDNCHTVTLMSNLAACLSQQSPPSDSKITRKHLIEDGQKWALKALEIDATIKPPQRSPECDEACVAATMNLGEMAEMLGEVGKARGRFQEALSLAKALGMEEGVKRAEEGLRRLEEVKTVVVTGPVVVEK
ncbi:hypothetical protein EX30DRAFT_309381 [Ascodesmis nigricans]|uniref:TPR-like protein n=1 Tax=Ascodesmis nigricans TaxID=341454 RepID=A0A4S2MSN1_9PEZI|nr:hypothetical protein EX30DRAFT_309381 [Ascodesmis nigricans]